jgi:hypothetical protein
MGTWESFRTLKVQNSIARVKTPRIGALFISFESYQSVDDENGLAWAIWTSVALIMAKRKVRNQTKNLTPDHQKSGINPTPMRAGGVGHTIGKLSTRVTTLLQTSSQFEVWAKSYSLAKCGSPNLGSFGITPWESRDKKPFGCGCNANAHEILYGGRWWLPSSPGRGESCESCESKVVRDLS